MDQQLGLDYHIKYLVLEKASLEPELFSNMTLNDVDICLGKAFMCNNVCSNAMLLGTKNCAGTKHHSSE